eukprot:TRINITY_DN1932_c0_g2_i5.p1 TRINITY_DN1932_c0_g2~~TRINITY_DN1932_c0_g2_i5.p1  ORF type:complete len:600 (-),score=96.06 TRINITY_DN1932_c0_g2_i5:53-1852(-)
MKEKVAKKAGKKQPTSHSAPQAKSREMIKSSMEARGDNSKNDKLVKKEKLAERITKRRNEEEREVGDFAIVIESQLKSKDSRIVKLLYQRSTLPSDWSAEEVSPLELEIRRLANRPEPKPIGPFLLKAIEMLDKRQRILLRDMKDAVTKHVVGCDFATEDSAKSSLIRIFNKIGGGAGKTQPRFKNMQWQIAVLEKIKLKAKLPAPLGDTIYVVNRLKWNAKEKFHFGEPSYNVQNLDDDDDDSDHGGSECEADEPESVLSAIKDLSDTNLKGLLDNLDLPFQGRDKAIKIATGLALASNEDKEKIGNFLRALQGEPLPSEDISLPDLLRTCHVMELATYASFFGVRLANGQKNDLAEVVGVLMDKGKSDLKFQSQLRKWASDQYNNRHREEKRQLSASQDGGENTVVSADKCAPVVSGATSATASKATPGVTSVTASSATSASASNVTSPEGIAEIQPGFVVSNEEIEALNAELGKATVAFFQLHLKNYKQNITGKRDQLRKRLLETVQTSGTRVWFEQLRSAVKELQTKKRTHDSSEDELATPAKSKSAKASKKSTPNPAPPTQAPRSFAPVPPRMMQQTVITGDNTYGTKYVPVPE